MANHLRRFVTSPLSIFEFEFATTPHTPSTLLAAARCLALCIDVCILCFPWLYSILTYPKLAPGDDLIMSYMYSLLNYIAATSKDTFDTTSVLAPSISDTSDLATVHSGETGLRGLSEDEKRIVGISTISVATQLALESKSEEARLFLHTNMTIAHGN